MSYSHSSIKTYEQCPASYKFSRIDKIPSESGPAAERGKLLHAEAEAVIKGGLPIVSEPMEHMLPMLLRLRDQGALSEEVISLTKDWEITDYDADDVRLRGIIDVLLIEGPIAYVRDFKSGKKRDYSDQLKLYAAMVFAKYPDVNAIQPIIDYIDIKKSELYTRIMRKEESLLREWINERMMKIDNDKIYAPNPSSLCSYCSFRKNNFGPCRW